MTRGTAERRTDQSFRIAFITHEFVTECNTGGGLGNYLNKMTQALLHAGHVPEIFVTSYDGPSVIMHQGVRVHRVHPEATCGMWRWLPKPPQIPGLRKLRVASEVMSWAAQLAKAFEARDREAPFDVVQSADCAAVGMYLRPRQGRPHLVRCSMLAGAYAKWDDARKSIIPHLDTLLELRALRRAEIVYAPSEAGAKYNREKCNRPVHVVRPPAIFEIPAEVNVEGLPKRYFLHFGRLLRRKGTDWLARALPIAWKSAPDLKVLMAGKLCDFKWDELRQMWGEHADRVTYLGELPKSKLYSVLRRAAAAVLPSVVDNLPNTVIESLSLGIPVIGTRGASIDELVDQGLTGELVEMSDAPALADAMVRVWNAKSTVRPGFVWANEVARNMRPEVAVEAFLRLAGLRSDDLYDPADENITDSSTAKPLYETVGIG